MLSLFYFGAHFLQRLKEKIREAQVVVWFLVGETSELMEKPKMIIIHKTHPSFIVT
jgi:hypothetical protein